GLGVDGSASNERGDLFMEVKQALLVARARGGPGAMTPRDALRLGTQGGASALGRDDIGELTAGKRADFAVWRTDSLELGGADDPVAGLVLSGPQRVDRLYVAGEEVVRDGRLTRADELAARGHTAEDGRISELGAVLEPGAYRLLFYPPSTFFRSVSVEVLLSEGHYHVPLLISSYSCVSYRGS